MARKRIRLDFHVDEDVIAFLKEEAERRTSVSANGEKWTWRDLAWVRCSIMLEDWVREQRAARLSLATTHKHG
jgi:hypothetical protein